MVSILGTGFRLSSVGDAYQALGGGVCAVAALAYAAGHVFFVQDRELFARPFDLARLEFSGTATRVVPGIPVVGKLYDLGTLGGDNGTAVWINDRGEVVGEADISGNQASHAFLWRRGRMTDLGTLGDNSRAKAVNSRSQVVGHYFITGRSEPSFRHPFLRDDGGPMVDLNDLIPSGSSLELVDALDINERGEILGVGVPDRCFLISADTRTCSFRVLVLRLRAVETTRRTKPRSQAL